MTKHLSTKSIQQQLQHATHKLASISDYPHSEARSLLAFVLNQPISWLIAWPEFNLSDQHTNVFSRLIKRRAKGEPLAYLLGKKEFWSLNLKVTTNTLIPRPDTEILVELALKIITDSNVKSVLDLGTGSGAIALAIGSEKPHIKILATDCSSTALEVAQANKEHLNIHNVKFIKSDWFTSIKQKNFDLIVSNPPYIPRDKMFLDDTELSFEPEGALFSGSKGLDDIEFIISSAREYLASQGVLALEHGYNQAAAVCELFKQYQYIDGATIQDYAHNDRVSYARFV